MSKITEDIQRYFGVHRVIEPRGTLPQPAWKLDNTPMALPTETLINVQKLHIDSASFTQIAHACGRDTERMKRHIMDIIAVRGKMHNPVTGSGGVLIGTVEQLDESFGEKHHLAIGDTIVSLTSLSWLPLYLEHIHHIYLDRSEVEVEGKAIFFRSNPLAKLPEDLPQSLVVAALDVAGAPSRVAALVRPEQRVTVLGAGGTAGLLTLCALRKQLGSTGTIIAIEYSEKALQDIASLGVADILVQADATRPLDLLERIRRKFEIYRRNAAIESTYGRQQCKEAYADYDYLADLAINVVNVPNTEFATILLTKTDGCILFFSMATSFTVAALGAEGVARQVEMHIGNGYMPDRGAVALQLLRDNPTLRAIFAERFGS